MAYGCHVFFSASIPTTRRDRQYIHRGYYNRGTTWCIEFAVYILPAYVEPESRYPPMFWPASPVDDSKRTTDQMPILMCNSILNIRTSTFSLALSRRHRPLYTSRRWHWICHPLVASRTSRNSSLSWINTKCMSEKNYQGYDSSRQLQTSSLRGQIYNLQSNLRLIYIHCSIVFVWIDNFYCLFLLYWGAIIIKINHILL